MVAVRALQSRVSKLEQFRKPKQSPFVRWYGSFDNFVNVAIRPGYLDGTLDQKDIFDIVSALRSWETDGTWDRAG